MEYLNMHYQPETRVFHIRGDKDSLKRLSAMLSNAANYPEKFGCSALGKFRTSPDVGNQITEFTVEVDAPKKAKSERDYFKKEQA
jgi:hypothetical protein